MNPITLFDQLRPDDEPLDSETSNRVWREIVATEPSNPGVLGVPSIADYNEHDHSEPFVIVTTNSPPTRRRFALLAGAAAVLLLGAVGFAATQRNHDSASIRPVSGPTTDYEPTATNAFRLLRESQTAVGNIDTLAGPLIQSCMAAKGFTFTPNSTVLMVEQDRGAFLLQRYPEPRQQDGTWGYVFENLSAGLDPIEPDNSPPAGRASAYREAFNGKTVASGVVSDLDGKVVTSNQIGDGCYGQSMATIMGSQQAFIDFFAKLQTLEAITGQSFNLVRNSTDYLARNQLWSQCMKNAGFDYRTISDTWNQDWPSPRPSETEQKVAETDAGCRRGRSLDGSDLYLVEAQTLSDLLLAHPLGDYSVFDFQVQALLVGDMPSTREAPGAAQPLGGLVTPSSTLASLPDSQTTSPALSGSSPPLIPVGSVVCLIAGASQRVAPLCADELGGAVINARSISDESLITLR